MELPKPRNYRLFGLINDENTGCQKDDKHYSRRY
jgi:hypothetical protein